MSTIRGILNKQDRAIIHDDLTHEVLKLILIELKRINLALELITNNPINEDDVNVN